MSKVPLGERIHTTTDSEQPDANQPPEGDVPTGADSRKQEQLNTSYKIKGADLKDRQLSQALKSNLRPILPKTSYAIVAKLQNFVANSFPPVSSLITAPSDPIPVVTDKNMPSIPVSLIQTQKQCISTHFGLCQPTGKSPRSTEGHLVHPKSFPSMPVTRPTLITLVPDVAPKVAALIPSVTTNIAKEVAFDNGIAKEQTAKLSKAELPGSNANQMSLRVSNASNDSTKQSSTSTMVASNIPSQSEQVNTLKKQQDKDMPALPSDNHGDHPLGNKKDSMCNGPVSSSETLPTVQQFPPETPVTYDAVKSTRIQGSPNQENSDTAKDNNELLERAKSYRFASGNSQTPLYVSQDIVLSGGIAQQNRRRIIHNQVEKRRKEKINGWIGRIGELLFKYCPEKQSKNVILEKTYEFIQEKQQESRINSKSCSCGGQVKDTNNLPELVAKIAELENLVKVLLQTVTKHKVPVPQLVKQSGAQFIKYLDLVYESPQSTGARSSIDISTVRGGQQDKRLPFEDNISTVAKATHESVSRNASLPFISSVMYSHPRSVSPENMVPVQTEKSLHHQSAQTNITSNFSFTSPVLASSTCPLSLTPSTVINNNHTSSVSTAYIPSISQSCTVDQRKAEKTGAQNELTSGGHGSHSPPEAMQTAAMNTNIEHNAPKENISSSLIKSSTIMSASTITEPILCNVDTISSKVNQESLVPTLEKGPLPARKADNTKQTGKHEMIHSTELNEVLVHRERISINSSVGENLVNDSLRKHASVPDTNAKSTHVTLPSPKGSLFSSPSFNSNVSQYTLSSGIPVSTQVTAPYSVMSAISQNSVMSVPCFTSNTSLGPTATVSTLANSAALVGVNVLNRLSNKRTESNRRGLDSRKKNYTNPKQSQLSQITTSKVMGDSVHTHASSHQALDSLGMYSSESRDPASSTSSQELKQLQLKQVDNSTNEKPYTAQKRSSLGFQDQTTYSYMTVSPLVVSHTNTSLHSHQLSQCSVSGHPSPTYPVTPARTASLPITMYKNLTFRDGVDKSCSSVMPKRSLNISSPLQMLGNANSKGALRKPTMASQQLYSVSNLLRDSNQTSTNNTEQVASNSILEKPKDTPVNSVVSSTFTPSSYISFSENQIPINVTSAKQSPGRLNEEQREVRTTSTHIHSKNTLLNGMKAVIENSCTISGDLLSRKEGQRNRNQTGWTLDKNIATTPNILSSQESPSTDTNDSQPNENGKGKKSGKRKSKETTYTLRDDGILMTSFQLPVKKAKANVTASATEVAQKVKNNSVDVDLNKRSPKNGKRKPQSCDSTELNSVFDENRYVLRGKEPTEKSVNVEKYKASVNTDQQVPDKQKGNSSRKEKSTKTSETTKVQSNSVKLDNTKQKKSRKGNVKIDRKTQNRTSSFEFPASDMKPSFTCNNASRPKQQCNQPLDKVNGALVQRQPSLAFPKPQRIMSLAGQGPKKADNSACINSQSFSTEAILRLNNNGNSDANYQQCNPLHGHALTVSTGNGSFCRNEVLNTSMLGVVGQDSSFPTILNIFAPVSLNNMVNFNNSSLSNSTEVAMPSSLPTVQSTYSNFSAESLIGALDNQHLNNNLTPQHSLNENHQNVLIQPGNQHLFTDFSTDALLSASDTNLSYGIDNIMSRQENAAAVSCVSPSWLQNSGFVTENSPIKSIMSILESNAQVSSSLTNPHNQQNISVGMYPQTNLSLHGTQGNTQQSHMKTFCDTITGRTEEVAVSAPMWCWGANSVTGQSVANGYNSMHREKKMNVTQTVSQPSKPGPSYGNYLLVNSVT